MMSTEDETYAQVQDLGMCASANTKEYICHPTQIVSSNIKSSCEAPLLTSTSDSCDVKTIAANIEIWHQINPNEWLYALSQPTTVTIMCSESRYRVFTIDSTGPIPLAVLNSFQRSAPDFVASTTEERRTFLNNQDDRRPKVKIAAA
ncbi:hypothetical protein RUM43_006588 [Polyplax serrata]|uniref:Uncharacterized protein n=1 Tax=Polyplax serrata TaxID=468196 RepID=A0AAN8PBP4_POLSC